MEITSTYKSYTEKPQLHHTLTVNNWKLTTEIRNKAGMPASHHFYLTEHSEVPGKQLGKKKKEKASESETKK